MTEWNFPKKLQTFNPAGTKFEQVFKDQIALIAYAQYRRKHLVSERENEWLPHFALIFANVVRIEGRRQISLEDVVRIWEKIWRGHPRSCMPSTTDWAVIIKPIMPFIRGDLILALTTDEKSGKFFLVTRSDRIIFHLRRHWILNPHAEKKDQLTTDLYAAFLNGDKTSEWRDMRHYWARRLFSGAVWDVKTDQKQDLTRFLKVHRAWLVTGYPKGNLPRLEADIAGVIFHPLTQQLQIKVANIKEVKQA